VSGQTGGACYLEAMKTFFEKTQHLLAKNFIGVHRRLLIHGWH
jgi:hypothetical protein